jgi:hypothetical protein
MITILFLIAGFWGIFMGLIVYSKPNFFLTALGMVNISLGIFLGFRTLRMSDKQLDRRRQSEKKINLIYEQFYNLRTLM